MTNTPTYDFTQLQRLLQSAGITVSDAAKIFKVSRQTLYAWMRGTPPNQKLLLDTAERLVAIISRAVEARDLPVMDADDEKRFNEIMLRLKRHINA